MHTHNHPTPHPHLVVGRVQVHEQELELCVSGRRGLPPALPQKRGCALAVGRGKLGYELGCLLRGVR